jgi:hypothetical protein
MPAIVLHGEEYRIDFVVNPVADTPLTKLSTLACSSFSVLMVVPSYLVKTVTKICSSQAALYISLEEVTPFSVVGGALCLVAGVGKTTL